MVVSPVVFKNLMSDDKYFLKATLFRAKISIESFTNIELSATSPHRLEHICCPYDSVDYVAYVPLQLQS